MITAEFLFRAVAAVSAAAILVGPTVLSLLKKARVTAVNKDDAHVIIEIARRLQEAGNAQGVALCQKLLEVFLAVESSKSK